MSNAAFFIVPFLVDCAVSGALIVLNLFAQDLRASPFELGLLGFTWGTTFTVGCVVVGRLADRYPRRRLMAAGVAGLGVVIWCSQWMPSPRALALINLVLGTACAFFWPVFETLLHHRDKALENRRIGLFNLGWTFGISAGMGAGGFLSQWGAHHGLNALTALTFAALAAFLWVTRAGVPPVMPEAPPHDLNDNAAAVPPVLRLTYLRVAWVANFTLWFAGATVSNLLPKLCRSLAIPDQTTGLLLALVMVAQAVSFFLVSRTTSWHYRFLPMVCFQALAIAGCWLLAIAGGVAGLALAMTAMGIGRGLTYSCSLYYSLAAESGRGANVGIHEMLIGAASLLGSLLGGAAAQWVDLRAPFSLGAAVGLLGLAPEVILWRRQKLRER